MQDLNAPAPGDDADDALTPEAPSGRLIVEVTRGTRDVVVTLTGELDLETALEVNRELQSLGEIPFAHLVIDLGAVTFMDSTGLSSIVAANRAVESRGQTLALRPGSRQVQRLFELTGVGERLTFEDE